MDVQSSTYVCVRHESCSVGTKSSNDPTRIQVCGSYLRTFLTCIDIDYHYVHVIILVGQITFGTFNKQPVIGCFKIVKTFVFYYCIVTLGTWGYLPTMPCKSSPNMSDWEDISFCTLPLHRLSFNGSSELWLGHSRRDKKPSSVCRERDGHVYRISMMLFFYQELYNWQNSKGYDVFIWKIYGFQDCHWVWKCTICCLRV